METAPDQLLSLLAEYVSEYQIESEEAYQMALLCLMDSLGCAILSLNFNECKKLLGPVVPGTLVPNGSRVPGTSFALDPIRAAFNIGTMIRWLDYNDTWLAAEWGHPSDNLGGILATADFLSRKRIAAGDQPISVKEVLSALIKAYEIQGGLALLNSFNQRGFDHVILVKVATAAVVTQILGGTYEQIANAISQAFADNGPLRAYRHYPNTGSRKSWAAGDATSRGVFFAFMTLQGEMGYPQVLTASKWGLFDVVFGGIPLKLERPLGTYIVENILFKNSFPAEFHAQTAVECGFRLHPLIKNKSIQKITIETHEAALKIIDKKGPLANPADRDHCLQYMVAVALLKGSLKAEDYEDEVAKDPRIDELRHKMVLIENKQYSLDYRDPCKRSIPNAIFITFEDGSESPKIAVEYPLGHRRRRAEGVPLIYKKFEKNLDTQYPSKNVKKISHLFKNREKIEQMPINQLIDLFVNLKNS